MLEKIREIIAEEYTDVDVTLDTDFREDLGIDSLDLFEMIMVIEDEYSIEIPVEELEDVHTVGDLINYLKSRGVEE